MNQEEDETCWMVDVFDLDGALQDARRSLSEFIEDKFHDLERDLARGFDRIYVDSTRRRVQFRVALEMVSAADALTKLGAAALEASKNTKGWAR